MNAYERVGLVLAAVGLGVLAGASVGWSLLGCGVVMAASRLLR